MIVVEWQGRHGERIMRIKKPALGRVLVIYEEDDDRKEHFPERPDFPGWNPKRKITDLPDPPIETR